LGRGYAGGDVDEDNRNWKSIQHVLDAVGSPLSLALSLLLCLICEPRDSNEGASVVAGDAPSTLQALQLLSRLHQLHDGQRALQLPIERLARRMAAQSDPATRNSIYERLLQGELAGDDDQDELRTML